LTYFLITLLTISTKLSSFSVFLLTLFSHQELLPNVVLVEDEVVELLDVLHIPGSASPLLTVDLLLGGIRAVGEVVEVKPIRRGRAVHIIVPIADSKFLIEAGVVAAHIRNSPAILVTHVEYHAVKFQVCIEANGSVCAVEVECYVRHVSPASLDVVLMFSFVV